MSDGIGDISYNTPSVSGAVPPFVNLAGARNGTSVDAGSFVVLGQDSGAAGDPAALLGSRQIPMPGGSELILTGFDMDPARTGSFSPNEVLFFYDSNIGGASVQMLDVSPNGLGSRFFPGQIELDGNTSLNAPASINMLDGGGLSTFTITGNDQAGLIGGWTVFFGSQSANFSVINFTEQGTMQLVTQNVGIAAEHTAILQLDSAKQGFLLPRMKTSDKNSITSPPTALQVFDTSTNKTSIWKGAFWVDQKDIFSGAVAQAVVAQTVFTVTIGVTLASANYQVAVTPTSALSAAPFSVQNKTTTTFQVIYLAGLTGTVNFDWTVIF